MSQLPSLPISKWPWSPCHALQFKQQTLAPPPPPVAVLSVQDLDLGDLVVTQDFKGAGLWTAAPDADNAPFLKLKKTGRDSTGEGILGRSVRQETLPRRAVMTRYQDVKYRAELLG